MKYREYESVFPPSRLRFFGGLSGGAREDQSGTCSGEEKKRRKSDGKVALISCLDPVDEGGRDLTRKVSDLK